MGFVNTGNTNTLELNLTDYGKKYVGGASGISFLQVLGNSKFALRDHGVDYRRFSQGADPPAPTSTNGPCYDQQYPINPYIERLSGTCFFNYPDIRGRGTGGLCLKTLSQSSDIIYDGNGIGWNDNLLYIDVPGIQPSSSSAPPLPPPIPDDDGEIVIPPQTPPEQPIPVPPTCFDSGYDSTVFGLNEAGCACTTYSNAWEDTLGISQNIGTGGFAYYYPSWESVFNVIANTILANNISSTLPPSFWGPLQGIGTGLQLNQVQTTDTGGLIGDVYGDGNLGCDDIAWLEAIGPNYMVV